MLFATIIILALIQGVTEFLPVSSAAHLQLCRRWLGLEYQSVFFDVLLHLGTLSAVVFYFRKPLIQCIVALPDFMRACIQPTTIQALSPTTKATVNLIIALLIATVPAIVSGFVVHKLNLSWLRSDSVIAINSIVFGFALYYSDRIASLTKNLEDLTWRDGLIIGLAQALAVIPGVSRSGIALTAALWLGYRRPEAVLFTFLLSIPVILGALTLEGDHFFADRGSPHDQHLAIHSIQLLPMLGGAIIAGTIGFLVIKGIMLWSERNNFTPFVIYRVALGLGLLWWQWWHH